MMKTEKLVDVKIFTMQNFASAVEKKKKNNICLPPSDESKNQSHISKKADDRNDKQSIERDLLFL